MSLHIAYWKKAGEAPVIAAMQATDCSCEKPGADITTGTLVKESEDFDALLAEHGINGIETYLQDKYAAEMV